MKSVNPKSNQRYEVAEGRPPVRPFRFCGQCLRLAAALVLAPVGATACGPWFPNYLLDGGDPAVLVAPRASFIVELPIEGEPPVVPEEGAE